MRSVRLVILLLLLLIQLTIVELPWRKVCLDGQLCGDFETPWLIIIYLLMHGLDSGSRLRRLRKAILTL